MNTHMPIGGVRHTYAWSSLSSPIMAEAAVVAFRVVSPCQQELARKSNVHRGWASSISSQEAPTPDTICPGHKGTGRSIPTVPHRLRGPGDLLLLLTFPQHTRWRWRPSDTLARS